MWSARQERSRFGCVVNGRRDFLVCWSGAMRRGTRADDARDGSRTGAWRGRGPHESALRVGVVLTCVIECPRGSYGTHRH
jgi:hypothetical protein